MSTQKERDGIALLMLKEWPQYVRLLEEQGQTWETADPSTWPADSELRVVHARLEALEKAAKVVGSPYGRARLHEQYLISMEVRRMDPDYWEMIHADDE
jgi:hypothetical protein